MKFFKWHILSEDDYQELTGRIEAIEKHFVVERDAKGAITKTLADVPYRERRSLKKNINFRGTSWPQRRAWLEATEGGKYLNAGEVPTPGQTVSVKANG